MSQCPLNI